MSPNPDALFYSAADRVIARLKSLQHTAQVMGNSSRDFSPSEIWTEADRLALAEFDAARAELEALDHGRNSRLIQHYRIVARNAADRLRIMQVTAAAMNEQNVTRRLFTPREIFDILDEFVIEDFDRASAELIRAQLCLEANAVLESEG